MKTIKFLSARTVAMALAVSFLFVACSKDEDEEPAPSTPSYYLTCKINGVNYSAAVPMGLDTTSAGYPYYVVSDNDSMATSLLMLGLMDDPASTLWGTEALYVDPAMNIYDEILTNYPFTSNVSHDSINHVISGTFAFHLADSWDTTLQVVVTEGRYKVKY